MKCVNDNALNALADCFSDMEYINSFVYLM